MQMDILPEDLGRVCGVVRLCTQGRVDLWMSGFGVGRVDGNHEGCGWGGGGELSASRVICVREKTPVDAGGRRWTPVDAERVSCVSGSCVCGVDRGACVRRLQKKSINIFKCVRVTVGRRPGPLHALFRRPLGAAQPHESHRPGLGGRHQRGNVHASSAAGAIQSIAASAGVTLPNPNPG